MTEKDEALEWLYDCSDKEFKEHMEWIGCFCNTYKQYVRWFKHIAKARKKYIKNKNKELSEKENKDV